MSNHKNKLIVIPNEDKTFHEKVDETNLCNFPHPFRMILCGPPNTGKTNTIYNILLNKKPCFDRIIVYHNDPTSKEYQNIDCDYVEELPIIDDIDENIKNLIIIEDIDYKNIKKDQKSLLDRYFGCFSTHHNISIIITGQDSFSIPASIRRMCSHVMLWKNHDISSMNILASRFGLKTQDLKYIFTHICKEPRDSLLIDTTRPKQRLRKNIYDVIEFY